MKEKFFVKAPGPIHWILSKTRYIAICNPLTKKCYTLKDYLPPEDWLYRHERQHILQIERLGLIRFCLSYLKESFLHGYNGNKYELEAQRAELDETIKNPYLTSTE